VTTSRSKILVIVIESISFLFNLEFNILLGTETVKIGASVSMTSRLRLAEPFLL
jgi:hypothetical protein